MKKEWLIGGMIGFITTFTIILVDSLTTWPYIVQLLLALILGVLMTVAVHKLVQSNKNIYRTIRYVQIVLGFTLLLALTLNFFEVIHVM